VRSFEALYGSEVKAGRDEPRLGGLRAQSILEELAGALERMTGELLKRLQEDRKIKYHHIPGGLGDGDGIGIYSGQLFHVIREIKTEADTQQEEQLKRDLLGRILGDASLHLARHNGRDYFCASVADWERVLGFRPEVKNA
jgi:hypothetical protein